MEVYWFSGSAPAWRVQLSLAVKQQPYDSHRLDASKGQHKMPEYLALNPRGKVPAIRDEEYTLAESLAIMAYLDRKFPEPPLFGRSDEETGHIWTTILNFEYYALPIAMRIILPIFFGTHQEKAGDIKLAAAELEPELKGWESILELRDWLVGDTITAADIAVFPFIEVLLRCAGKNIPAARNLGLLPFDDLYPALDSWRARVMAVPGYDATYPPHWREAA